MTNIEEYVEQVNPIARRTLWLLLVCCSSSLLFFFSILEPFRIPAIYVMPILLAYLLVVAIRFFLLGRDEPSVFLFLMGVAFVIGGAVLDIGATLIHTPSLELEANVFVHTMLDSGHSLTFVYVYGAIVQTLVVSMLCALWGGFLRHYDALIEFVWSLGPQSYYQFGSMATSAEKNSLTVVNPFRGNRPFPIIMSIAVMGVGLNLYRWHLGLSWFNVALLSRTQALVLTVLLTLAVYYIWLYVEYRKGTT